MSCVLLSVLSESDTLFDLLILSIWFFTSLTAFNTSLLSGTCTSVLSICISALSTVLIISIALSRLIFGDTFSILSASKLLRMVYLLSTIFTTKKNHDRYFIFICPVLDNSIISHYLCTLVSV